MERAFGFLPATASPSDSKMRPSATFDAPPGASPHSTENDKFAASTSTDQRRQQTRSTANRLPAADAARTPMKNDCVILIMAILLESRLSSCFRYSASASLVNASP